MDLSSHGRKRSSQDAPDRRHRVEEEQGEENRMLLEKGSEKLEDATKKIIDKKDKKEAMSTETSKVNPFQFVTPIYPHRVNPPISRFPQPCDLSMNIQGMRRHNSNIPSTQMSPPYTDQHLEKTVGLYQAHHSSIENVTDRQTTSLASLGGESTACSSPYEAQCVASTITSPPRLTLVSETTTASSKASTCSTLQQYSPSQPSHRTHFHKGSLIQLASGQMKKVEDLDTEDFISSARSNQDVTLDHSTLVKIEKHGAPGYVALTFSVGRKRLLVTTSAAEDHPFFVYGSSWSSISPSLSMARYNLSCSKLSLGDVCISLTNSTHSRSTIPLSDTQEGIMETIGLPRSSDTFAPIIPITAVSESTPVTY